MLTTTLIGLLALFPTNPAILSANIAEAAQISPQQEWLHSLENCESHGNPTKAIVDSNGYWSRGILQFQLSTWLKYHDRFGTTRDNIFDPELQERVASYILDQQGGWRNWWTCAHRTQRLLGDWPM